MNSVRLTILGLALAAFAACQPPKGGTGTTEPDLSKILTTADVQAIVALDGQPVEVVVRELVLRLSQRSPKLKSIRGVSKALDHVLDVSCSDICRISERKQI